VLGCPLVGDQRMAARDDCVGVDGTLGDGTRPLFGASLWENGRGCQIGRFTLLFRARYAAS
jgi:hypothetical protein